MILEKQLLLPIDLRRLIRPFPINLEPISLQRERLFTINLARSGRPSKFTLMLREDEKTQELRLRLYRPRLAC